MSKAGFWAPWPRMIIAAVLGWALAAPASAQNTEQAPDQIAEQVSDITPDVTSTGRHVYIMHQGLDQVIGSYLFLITNKSGENKQASIPLMLPQGVEEFMPGEGVTKKEIKLNGDGTLQIAKNFAPGEQLVSINFRLPATGGTARFAITPTAPISTVKLMSPTGTLSFAGESGKFTLNKEVPFSRRVYDTLSVDNPAMNTPYVMTIGNVPEGRAEFWQLGIAIAAILLGIMVTAAITRLNQPSQPAAS